jgi:glucose/arabinose dehydrogenase
MSQNTSKSAVRTRVVKRLAPLVIAPIGCLLLSIPPVSAQTVLPSGFGEVQYAQGLTEPVAMAFAPDPCPASGTPVHRLFVCEQAGTLRVYRNGVLQPTPFLTVATDTRGERGLDGICFDPNFAANGYVYVYYTLRPANQSQPTHNRLSRFTADPANPDRALAGSETRILDLPNLYLDAYVHNGSAIHFGPDGKLYIAVGENAYPPYAQSLANPFGKILRINPVPENPDGTIPEATFPTDNPFYNTTTGLNRAIYCLGLRNPFTFSFQPGTGRMFIDNVGDATWEEINEGLPGRNYGWPTCEGNCQPPVPGLTSPIYAYQHYSGTPRGCAITGGAFYNPPTRCSGDPPYGFPSSYVGQYFFMDYCRGWIYTMDPNQIDPASPYGYHRIAPFATGLHGYPTYLTVGPDGNLYYISRTDGAVYQIRYPASLAPTIGTEPADVLVGQGWPATFTVDASGVPPLHYRWQRNDADIAGAADAPSYTLQNPTVANDDQARYRCIVSNSYGSTTTQEAVLSVTTKQPPVPTVTMPLNTYYDAGDVIVFRGAAVDGHDIVTGDPQDGVLGPGAFTWQVLFEHHRLNDPNHHTHPFIPPTSGTVGGYFTIPTSGETAPDVWYRILFTARDSYGLSTTIFKDIFPEHSYLSVTTNPAVFPGTSVPLKVKVDASPKNAPYRFWGVVNLRRNIGVDTPQVFNGLTYDFSYWSDGGGRFHNIATPHAESTYVANFVRRPAYGTITANPNPIRLSPGSNTGTTQVFWSSAYTGTVEVHRDSPSGPLFARTGAGEFSQASGNWVTEGTKLFLQDVSQNQPLTEAFTLDSVTLHVTSSPVGSITADPNPFAPDLQGLGDTRIAWTSYGTTAVQIRVGAPNGREFTSSGPGSFTAPTGHWVQEGETFYLQNVSNGLPLTPANTLARVTMIALDRTARGWVSALPNPFTPDAQGLGQTTVAWTSYGTTNVQIRVGAPNGVLFAGSGPGSFFLNTARWVSNGMTFYLQNISNGRPLTPANTLATVTMTGSPPRGSISANPNPFIPDPQGLGQTTLTWSSVGTTRVEVHVNAPNGNIFTSSGAGTFSANTGHWVQNGQTYYLQNVSNGLPLTSANTLATVTVHASP